MLPSSIEQSPAINILVYISTYIQNTHLHTSIYHYLSIYLYIYNYIYTYILCIHIQEINTKYSNISWIMEHRNANENVCVYIYMVLHVYVFLDIIHTIQDNTHMIYDDICTHRTPFPSNYPRPKRPILWRPWVREIWMNFKVLFCFFEPSPKKTTKPFVKRYPLVN